MNETQPLPQTVSEARAFVAKSSGEFRKRLQSRIATEKAKLLLERGSGTIAHIRRIFESRKSYALLARIKVERGLRKVPKALALLASWLVRGIWSLLSVDMGDDLK